MRLLPQSPHRISHEDPNHGDDRGEHSGGDQNHGHAGVDRRIVRIAAHQDLTHEWGQKPADTEADCDPDQHRRQTLTDVVAYDVRTLGAERHANPNLTHALTHGKGHHSIESDACEQKRDPPEDHEQRSEGSFLHSRSADQVVQRTRVFQRDTGVDGFECVEDAGNCCPGVTPHAGQEQRPVAS